MAFTTFGSGTFTYGAGTLTGVVVQSATNSTKNNIAAEVFNETGQRVFCRYDDLTTEVTIEGIINSGTLPVPGTTISYNSVTYELLSVDVKYDNKNFQMLTLKGKHSAYLSLGS